MSQPRPPVRATLFVRLLAILIAVAALPTFVVMAVQERALVSDLRDAATDRLERAGWAAKGLVEGHLAALDARYQAVSGTPQFRATLELGDEATLRFYAEQLAHGQGAAAIAFVPDGAAPVAAGPRPELVAAALSSTSAAPPGSEPSPREPSEGKQLFRHGEVFYTVTRAALETGGQAIGTLVAIEPFTDAHLAGWSATTGARLAIEPEARSDDERIGQVVLPIGDRVLTVSSDLAAERAALRHARRNLVAAGALALALAVFASVLLSRSWVQPIVAIQRAAEKLGEGEFGTLIASDRADEIGDVARAFDTMTARLEVQQSQLIRKVHELKESQDRLRSAQRLARMGSWRYDLATGRVDVSDELLDLFGLEPSERGAFGPKDLLRLLHPDDLETVKEAVLLCVSERSSLRIDHRVVGDDGVERVLQTQARFVRDGAGREVALEGTAQDMTERHRSEEQIRYLAYHDGLTSLGNRRFLQERLELAVAEARRSRGGLGVIVLDLDVFKRVNDTLGHGTGDRLIQGVADRLARALQGEDERRVGEPVLARIGGDEFAVLLTGRGEVRDMARVARRLLAVLARPFDLDGHEIVTTASVGVAAWPADGEDAETLLRNADAAMYHAKSLGRNDVQFYRSELNDEGLQRLLVETRLRHALDEEQLDVYYQPKLDPEGSRVLGLEALVRWPDPELGMIPPAVFIPVAEEAGLIGRLGEWVLRRACADRQRWIEAGLHAAPIAVNLSAQQFRGGGLVGMVGRVLDETGLAPELLELEITESMLLDDGAVVVEALEALRGRGIAVALDDFGTGYSSLAYLRRLPVDALKLDQSFVQGIADDEGEAALASSIVSMARALGLRVVAEGVETEAQRALLAAWSCDELQGFLLARPMPQEQLLGWWRELDEGRASSQGYRRAGAA